MTMDVEMEADFYRKWEKISKKTPTDQSIHQTKLLFNSEMSYSAQCEVKQLPGCTQ